MDGFFSQHALFAGFASLLMIAVLPGLVMVKAGVPPGGWLLVPIVFCVSLVANFQVCFYLTLLGVYRIETLTFLFLAIVGWLALPHGRAALGAPSPDPVAEGRSQSVALRWLGMVIGLATIVPLLCRLANEVPGVFSAWDAVVSWNRWAQDWYQGNLPRNTYGYPQLVPGAWATTYVWLGSARIESWAKGLMALFPLAVIAIFFDMCVRLRSWAALVAIAVWVAVLMRVFPELIDSGYVDIPVSFFILLTAYVLLLVRNNCLSTRHGFTFAAMAAAGAVLTKQSGWLAALMLAWACVGAHRHPRGESRGAANSAMVFFFCLVGPWLVYKYFQIWTETDPSNFAYVTSNIYAGESLFERLKRALTVNTPNMFGALAPIGWTTQVLVTFSIAAIAAFQKNMGRICWLAVVLPYYVIWALFFSYDTRNLMPVIPFVALGLGVGIETIGEKLFLRLPFGTPKCKNSDIQRRSIGTKVPVAFAVSLFVLTTTLFIPVTRKDLQLINDGQRLNAGDAALNSFLLDYRRKVGFQGKILSTYAPIATIDGLREYVATDPAHPSPSVAIIDALKKGAPVCQVISLMPNHAELRYLLLHRVLYLEMVDKGIVQGNLRLLHETPAIRFLEISCPSVATTSWHAAPVLESHDQSVS